MSTEQIIEDGIVIESDKGIAEIALIENDNCEECSARLLCKPRESSSTKILKAADPFGALPGDEVRVSVDGKAILGATSALYGAPLLIIIVSILFGMEFFAETTQPELYSFLSGFGLMAVYFAGLYLISFLRKNTSVIPKIVFVKRKSQL